MTAHSDPFQWQTGQHFELLEDGDCFFPAMLGAIDQAQRFIVLEIYLVISGEITRRFIDHLGRAAARGVSVYVLFDAYGASAFSSHERAALLAQGVHLGFYNPLRLLRPHHYLPRNHRKILAIDGHTAFIGGVGLSDEFSPELRPGLAWRETVVALRGVNAADWCRLFVATWRQSQTLSIELPLPSPLAYGRQRGRIAFSPHQGQRMIKKNLLNAIRHARQRVWLSTAYFVPSRKIRRALRRAARQGVDVRLLLPGTITDHPAIRHAGRRFYNALLRSGVKIYEYQPCFLHQKVILCDQWVSIGSSNIDRWNLYWNLEANQEILDGAFASKVSAMLVRDFAQSHLIDPHTWLQRTRLGRLQEWFWGWVDRQLVRLSLLRQERLQRPKAKKRRRTNTPSNSDGDE